MCTGEWYITRGTCDGVTLIHAECLFSLLVCNRMPQFHRPDQSVVTELSLVTECRNIRKLGTKKWNQVGISQLTSNVCSRGYAGNRAGASAPPLRTCSDRGAVLGHRMQMLGGRWVEKNGVVNSPQLKWNKCFYSRQTTGCLSSTAPEPVVIKEALLVAEWNRKVSW